MKKIFLFLLTMLLMSFTLTGCTSSSMYYKMKEIKGEELYDDIKGVLGIHFAYSYPNFNNDNLKGLNEFLNREVEELKAYYPGGFADFYIDPESDWSKDMTFEEEYNCTTTYNSKDVVSVVINSYQYTGGAHGMTICYGKNYDINKQKFLNYEDVFVEGFEEEVIELIDYELSNPKEGEDYGLYSFYRESLNSIFPIGYDSFYFSENGVCFIYREYAIAPYASGTIHVEIPYEKINHLLKDEYKK